MTNENKRVALIRPSMNLSVPSAVEPLAQLHLGTILQKAGRDVQICDEAYQLVSESMLSEVDVACVTADTAQYSRAKAILDTIRLMDKGARTQRRVHLGGSHATAFGGILLNDGWDSVCVGEADLQIEDVIGLNYHGLVSGTNLSSEQWGTLPIPDRNLLRHQYGKNSGEDSASVFTARGCPFSCIYCFKGVRGQRITYRPLNHLFAELDDIVDRKYRSLYIYDDTFTIKPDRAIQIARYIDGRIPWSCNSRAKLDPSMLSAMREGGCNAISIGVETANQAGLTFIGKGILPSDAITAVRQVKDAGISARVYLMFGLPFDSNQTVDENLELIERMDPDGVQLALAIPLPGSELYRRAAELGIEIPDDTDLYYYIGPNGPHTYINKTNALNERDFARALHRLQQGIVDWAQMKPGRFTNVH